MKVAGELAVGEGGVALEGREGFGLPQHAAQGFEEAAGEIRLDDVFQDGEGRARGGEAKPFHEAEDAVALVDGVDLGPARGVGAAEFDVRGDKGGERGCLGEVGEERGAAGGDLEGFEAGEGELRDKFAHGGGHEFEVGLPVGGGEGFRGRGEGIGGGREGDPLGAVEALELDVGPVGDTVEDTTVRPGEGEWHEAEGLARAAGDGGRTGSGAGEGGAAKGRRK